MPRLYYFCILKTARIRKLSIFRLHFMRSYSLSSRARRMSGQAQNLPAGILAVQAVAQKCAPRLRLNTAVLYKGSILFLTYAAYTCYHMSRKPISVVKSVLQGNCTIKNDDNCGFAPFDGADSSKLFAVLDSAFLFSYALAMFGSGFIAERASLRYYLSFGMIGSGIFAYLFGLAKSWHIHSLWYFIIVQACAGIVQTTGWPGVVTLVGRWFGKSKRGFIFGVWNSHTSIGNILGTLIAANYVEKNWAASFMMPGIIIAIVGFILFLFVVDEPESVGCHVELSHGTSSAHESDIEENSTSVVNESTPILRARVTNAQHGNSRPIRLIDALYIPGVLEFSMCLFFAKLVSYTFLYWLPLYIQSSSTLGPETSADLSTTFDVGGIIGAIAAGTLSDYSGMPASVCAIMIFLSSPALLLYQSYGGISISISIVLLLIAGVLVNGPYALITTSVSAELGQHPSLEGNSQALATVTAIIDGTGSIGAAVGPLLAGLISSHGWQHVFYMLIASNTCAMLLLVRLVMKELSRLRRTYRIRTE